MKAIFKSKFFGKYIDDIVDWASNFIDVDFLGIFSMPFIINAVALALLGYIILKFYKDIKQKRLPLSPKSSISRANYKKAFIWNVALQFLIFFIFVNSLIKFAIMSQTGEVASGSQAVEVLLYLGEWFGISLISFVFIIFGMIWSIMRFHDLEKSGFMVLLTAIPVVNFYFFYILLSKEGVINSDNKGSTESEEPAPVNEGETESEGKKYSKFEKIVIGLVAFGIITTGIMDFINKTSESDIFYGYKLACGYWKKSDERYSPSVRIDTKTINTDPMNEGSRIGTMNYEILSVSSSSDDIIVKFKITSGAELIKGDESYGEMYFPKTNVNKMTLRFNWSSNRQYEYKETYVLNNSPYLRNLDNNLDIVLNYGRQGFAIYLDLSSIKKEVDDNGNINLSIDTISSKHDEKIYSATGKAVMSPGKKSGTIKYSIIDGLPYFGAVDDENRTFIDLDSTGNYSEDARRQAFLTTYFYAFGNNFSYPDHFRR